tara:strand:- start:1445 stop:2779 length:1335 start_codon:yes stop_codon:yes gene_type:complete
MGKKIEIWILFLVIILFFIATIFFGGILRDAYLKKNQTPKILRDISIFISEIPKNILFIIKRGNKPDILVKDSNNKAGFNRYINSKKNFLLILPKYNNDLQEAEVEVIDIKNFEVIHRYKHDINLMYEMFDTSRPEIKKVTVDDPPIRFEYRHPLILDDGSLISDSDYSPIFKIDSCSNLVWLNQEMIFHHSKMLDHEGNIWVPSQLFPYSNLISKNYTNFGEYADDTITKINKDGDILYSKSVSEILLENKIIGDTLYLNKFSDPIHLNDIEPALINSEHWKIGDLFLSIRHLSLIIHYRPSKNEVINYIKGPFFMQHDVDIISDKEISIFNNNNTTLKDSNSEILIYNFETKNFTKKFNNQLVKENFKTYSQGISEILSDGSMLVEEQNKGRLIFFNYKGEKEWEFENQDKSGNVFFVSWSRIIEDEKIINKLKNKYKKNKC